MKATGIVRRIDDLGRIVVPKEIRKGLNINETDPIEMFTSAEGTIILKKYSLIGTIKNIASQSEIVSNILNKPVFIFDTDNIISTGDKRFHFDGETISRDLYNSLNNRKAKFLNETNCVKITMRDENNYKEQYICPILSENSIVAGGIVVVSLEDKINEIDKNIISFVANLLSKQLT